MENGMKNNKRSIRPIRVVCFGGGTGMPSLLSGLKKNPFLQITAIVNMFDSGGSSGVLRDTYGILPPGDILRCVLALSDDEAHARRLLLKRIEHPAHPGHTGGNLLLFALEKVYGDYMSAVHALSQMLFARGSVIPVTLSQSTLCARYADESISKEEVAVDAGLYEGKIIKELFLDPPVLASQQALDAIKHADALCVGPGSFYTSVLSNFLPLGIKDAVRISSAPIMYIPNLVCEGSGMSTFSISALASVISEYCGRDVSTIIANTSFPSPTVLDVYAQEQKFPIRIQRDEENDIRLKCADLWIDPTIARHNSARLAYMVFRLLSEHRASQESYRETTI